ncbi:MAG: hypothetical protein V8T00_09605 [Oscillospiraceae bacterium]
MRRSGRVLLIVLAVLVVLAGAGAAVVLRLDTRAKEQHEMLSRAILARETWLSDTRIRLTENGAELGSYTLEDLGLAEAARSYITVGLTQLDLLPQEEFEALGLRERISWSLGGPRKRAERDVGCGKPRYGKARGRCKSSGADRSTGREGLV